MAPYICTNLPQTSLFQILAFIFSSVIAKDKVFPFATDELQGKFVIPAIVEKTHLYNKVVINKVTVTILYYTYYAVH